MLIDIHTHLRKFQNKENTKCLRFIVGRHSLGIHPWELVNTEDVIFFKDQFITLKQSLTPTVLALGECGLDRRRKNILDISYQKEILEWHLDWAIEVQKPIIIHCVKAFSDLLSLLKLKKYKGKLLIHDFSGNLQEAQKLLQFDCFFSFGSSLFKANHHSSFLIQELPKEKIFLETDDQVIYEIDQIYEKAQFLLNMSSQELENLFEKNLYNFFSNLNNVSTADIVDNLSCGKNI